jgi:hypothetical protein
MGLLHRRLRRTLGAWTQRPVYVIRHAHDALEEVIIYGMTWLLLLSGVRVAFAYGAGARTPRTCGRSHAFRAQIWARCGSP